LRDQAPASFPLRSLRLGGEINPECCRGSYDRVGN
jgi:hypothetical protein